ncbi:N-acetylmuramic acid 6-phosphate etherase [Marinitenerispora sediminis]|uniref:N-acetylmuramic acid 6-phosphate etherase n=1 Tax=Marinitenerispora sediminis TaxID=1931232 RepID=A0A368TBI0_9ACTN|nr:N-acetylmuramic acid 6-phosphate etherase [Marinitenerispora sediminis]RCV51690.1 N-acetylmuramic acid 6-phosphate etherase [Marinitenerispora sediminis]RCV58143.1 N-acetylmuramic acid 6-phosphate etherase [Marinitenerispora sediminis]RCV62514.1 N-acetylmuramic acid 6-phosphate etherase [Marinitenerispora sediminis]
MEPDLETHPAGAGGAAERVEVVRSPTEERNPRTLDIDLVPTLDALRLINAEDATVAEAVAAALPQVARAVDLGVAALGGGGRIHYFGAGTSGRLATMDAAELPPTYGIDPARVVAHHAGGEGTLREAAEGVEDDSSLGASDAEALNGGDLAVGLAASGRTPYVGGALRRARERGAHTVLVSANPAAALAPDVDVHIGVATGPEVIAGSTRMKAGTAQKLVLNAFSTAVMVRLGYTYSNLMVGVNAGNTKLRGRVVTILTEASGQPADVCAAALAAAGGDTRVALVCLLTGAEPDRAAAEVRAAGGSVRAALRRLTGV